MTDHNLPAQSTPFIGRTTELTEIAHRLADPACRLLTLIGPGGIGKSRLAVQAAQEQVTNFAHGAYFVALAPVGFASGIPFTVGNALHVSFYGQEPPVVQLLNYLRDKELLLVLDNFEHLLDGSLLVSELLAGAPQLKILATSRERLNVQEEWVLPLQGLRFPKENETGNIDEYSAVQLFVQNARRIQSSFALAADLPAVAAICRQVEGMPLGLELAASWLRLMSCQQIAARSVHGLDFLETPMRNVPERHRSLRAVFEQSWSLLSDAERGVLAKLSVFRGGFNLEAAEQVAGASLAVLASLADKSLMQLNLSGRYDLHELLRQFAANKLIDADEAEQTRNRHLNYFCKWVEHIEPKLRGADQLVWFDRLDTDHDNLRAALAWSQENDADVGLRLAGALWWFWIIRGYWIEGYEWLDTTVAIADRARTASIAKALMGQGMLAYNRGDRRVNALLEKSVALYQQVGDKWGLALSLSVLGRTDMHYDYQQSIVRCEGARQMFQELGDKWGVAGSCLGLGDIALHMTGDHDRAVEMLEESLRLGREVGDKWIMAHALLSLAEIPRLQKDTSRARVLLEECLDLFRSLRDKGYVAWALYILAGVARTEGDYKRATVLLEESLTLKRDMGNTRDVVYCLAVLGGIATAEGRAEQAAKLFGAVDVHFRAIRQVHPSAHADFDNDVATARDRLGEEAFSAAWAEGQAMTLEQAIAYSLQGKTPRLEVGTAEPPSSSDSSRLPQNANNLLAEALSPRELDVLRLLADGLRNAEIGQQLYLSVGTVKVHTRNIYGKLGVSNRTQAVTQAQKLNLL